MTGDASRDVSRQRFAPLRRFRVSAAQFLILLLALFVTTPLLEGIPHGELIEALLLTAVLISAVPSMGGTRRSIVCAVLLVIPALFGKWLNYLNPERFPPWVFLGPTLVFAIYIIHHHLSFILFSPKVDVHVLCAGISTFLMIGLLWAFLFLLVDNFAPGSFVVSKQAQELPRISGIDALFLSFSMLTGTTFDPVIPVSNSARMLCLMEAMTGMFYVAVLISRLVALHTSGQFEGLKSPVEGKGEGTGIERTTSPP